MYLRIATTLLMKLSLFEHKTLLYLLFEVITGRRPGFLYIGIRGHVHTFSITWAMTAHNSFELLANYFDVKMYLQPSASIPDGRALPLVPTTALFTRSASTSIFIGCASWGVFGNITLKSAALLCECFWFNWFKVVWFNARISFCMLSINP